MMRLATYNIEWFTNLFDSKNKLINDASWSSRYNVTKAEQTAAIGRVMQTIDADGIMIIEAPNSGTLESTITALEGFAAHFNLRQNKALVGFENDTQQEIAFLYDPEKMDVIHDPQGDPSDAAGARSAPRFDTTFKLDLDVDAQPDTIQFSKPPLEVAVFPKGGEPFRLIGVHAKSKAPHGARNKEQEISISIENRRKQLAQCIWIRQRVDAILASNDDVLVLGDFNDGPGLDEYERLFGQSSVEVVLGLGKPEEQTLFDPHAARSIGPRRGPGPTTSRFYNRTTKTYLNALLDFIMVSEPFQQKTSPHWIIWHPFDHPECFKDKPLSDALLTASDHFPVTIDFNLPAKG